MRMQTDGMQPENKRTFLETVATKKKHPNKNTILF